MDIEAIRTQIKDRFPAVTVKKVSAKNQHGQQSDYAVFGHGTSRLFVTAEEMAAPGFDLAATLAGKLGVRPQASRQAAPAKASGPAKSD